jgi:molecular chaperone IbpA
MNNALQKIDALNRALIGFDSMFDSLERRSAGSAHTNYPPYNVARLDENHYVIEMAVTGFDKSEIEITIERNELAISGERTEMEVVAVEYIYRGLALRNFERKFTLAEHMKVVSAEICNGVLTIKLEREVPEELKPRIIDIIEVK